MYFHSAPAASVNVMNKSLVKQILTNPFRYMLSSPGFSASDRGTGICEMRTSVEVIQLGRQLVLAPDFSGIIDKFLLIA